MVIETPDRSLGCKQSVPFQDRTCCRLSISELWQFFLTVFEGKKKQEAHFPWLSTPPVKIATKRTVLFSVCELGEITDNQRGSSWSWSFAEWCSSLGPDVPECVPTPFGTSSSDTKTAWWQLLNSTLIKQDVWLGRLDTQGYSLKK